MKKSKLTEGQISFALRQAEQSTRVAEICHKMGISEATFYKWKKDTYDMQFGFSLTLISRGVNSKTFNLL